MNNFESYFAIWQILNAVLFGDEQQSINSSTGAKMPAVARPGLLDSVDLSSNIPQVIVRSAHVYTLNIIRV